MSDTKKIAPYGTWESPINADTVLSASIAFRDVLVDPITNVVYHLEDRPDDHGRCVVVDTKAKKDVLPYPYNARTYVQEYGGAPAIVYNDIIYFSNDSITSPRTDNKIYALNLKEESAVPKPVTPENRLWRYANFAVHPEFNNLLVVVREDHTNDPNDTDPGEVVNTLCVVETNTASVVVVVEGADFYASPVLSPSGERIAWQQWDLPDMPWAGGTIYVADITANPEGLEVSVSHTLVAGQKGEISATFPRWITDTTLLYITDGVNKFQNPFVYHTDTNQPTQVLKTLLAQDFSEPAWRLGQDPYAILGDGTYAAFTAFQDGRNILYVIDLTQPSDPVPIENFDFTVAQHLRPATANSFVFTGSKSAEPGGVILGTVSGSDAGSYSVEFEVLKPSSEPSPLEKYISKPVPKTFTYPERPPIYAVYYPPYSPDYCGPDTERPPCVVGVHGGPTGLEPQVLNWTKMFYTSRGFAWLDVNYRGSSGYGRKYIDLLNGNWGIYDVEDCQAAATALADESEIDGTRVAVRGGSAGGYTTLASLTFAKNPRYYKTACSAYGGIADPTLLTKITEKFEMRYIYTLFGCPPDNGAWDPRTPIKHIVDSTGKPNFSVPLLMLHGVEDRVVPLSVARGLLSDITLLVPTGQIEFSFYANEGHGWHLAGTIKDALLREYTWYRKNLL